VSDTNTDDVADEPVYDTDESYDAGDELAGDDPEAPVEIEVDPLTKAILFADVLVKLRDEGFPQDPNDPDGSKLTEEDLRG
jgi:hypothetical protein